MPKFRICFRVDSTEHGSIEVEAASPEAAAAAFEAGAYESARLLADLDLVDSEDNVAEIHDIEHPERVWMPG